MLNRGLAGQFTPSWLAGFLAIPGFLEGNAARFPA